MGIELDSSDSAFSLSGRVCVLCERHNKLVLLVNSIELGGVSRVRELLLFSHRRFWQNLHVHIFVPVLAPVEQAKYLTQLSRPARKQHESLATQTN